MWLLQHVRILNNAKKEIPVICYRQDFLVPLTIANLLCLTRLGLFKRLCQATKNVPASEASAGFTLQSPAKLNEFEQGFFVKLINNNDLVTKGNVKSAITVQSCFFLFSHAQLYHHNGQEDHDHPTHTPR